jgi:hypothetical protein
MKSLASGRMRVPRLGKCVRVSLYYWRQTMRCMLLVGMLLALPALLWATHGHWIDQYRNASGSFAVGRGIVCR